MAQLDGKIALITGGNSGIGLGTAKRMVEEGAFVYLTGRNQSKLDHAADALGDNAYAIRADVTSKDEMQNVADVIRARHGRIEIVFANAGAAWYNTIENLTEEQIDHGLSLDIKGTISTVQAALPLMQDGSSIIVNTSITKNMGIPRFGVYAATKAGLRSFVRTWMNELRDRKIRVNAISPGTVLTEAYEKDFGIDGTKKMIADAKTSIPAGRIGQPEDIGNAVVFLASDQANFINGIELTVDGGQTQIHPN